MKELENQVKETIQKLEQKDRLKTGKKKKKERKSRPGETRRPNIRIIGIPEEENRENGEEETIYKILKKSCRNQFPK